MKRIDLIRRLAELERHGVFILAKRDIEKMFPDEADKAMEKSLQRMVADGLLARAAKGLYVNPAAASRRRGWLIEEVAKALRPGHLCYVSLESMLSEFGVISQIPISRITVMTTGGSGVVETPYGVIEFTHTKRSKADILSRTMVMEGRPLRIATKHAAYRDLVRVGRNVNMVDQEELAADD
ncbi:MAG: type IV toxin-antitoxin system AbiEi family antitoxin [Burkholderiales bacterium]